MTLSKSFIQCKGFCMYMYMNVYYDFFKNCHAPYKSSCLKCMYVFPSLISNLTKVFKGQGQYRWKMKTWLNYVKTNHYLLSLLSLWPYVKVFECHFSLSFHMLVIETFLKVTLIHEFCLIPVPSFSEYNKV